MPHADSPAFTDPVLARGAIGGASVAKRVPQQAIGTEDADEPAKSVLNRTIRRKITCVGDARAEVPARIVLYAVRHRKTLQPAAMLRKQILTIRTEFFSLQSSLVDFGSISGGCTPPPLDEGLLCSRFGSLFLCRRPRSLGDAVLRRFAIFGAVVLAVGFGLVAFGGQSAQHDDAARWATRTAASRSP